MISSPDKFENNPLIFIYAFCTCMNDYKNDAMGIPSSQYIQQHYICHGI